MRRILQIGLNVGIIPSLLEYDPNPMVDTLRNAFGGELWVNGHLCSKEGKQILRAFVFGDLPSRIKEYWGTSQEQGWQCVVKDPHGESIMDQTNEHHRLFPPVTRGLITW